MVDRAEQLRENARRCELEAKETADRMVRYLLRDIARQWRELAEQVETLDNQRMH